MKRRGGRFRLLLGACTTCAFTVEKRPMTICHAVAVAPDWIYLLAVRLLHEEMMMVLLRILADARG